MLEIGKLFEFVQTPVYLYYIISAHFFLLNAGQHNEGFELACEGKLNLRFVWLQIEAAVFYGWIAAHFVFTMLNFFCEISERYRYQMNSY